LWPRFFPGSAEAVAEALPSNIRAVAAASMDLFMGCILVISDRFAGDTMRRRD
jgi:hypothetical protein